MNDDDATRGPDDALRDDSGRSPGADGPVSAVRRSLPGGSGAAPFAGVAGAVLALRGLRRIRRGARVRGLFQALLGAGLVAVAVGRRRSTGPGPEAGGDHGGATGVDRTDVVDTAPDVEDVAGSSADESVGHATGDEAAAVAESSVDVEDVAAGDESVDDEAPADEDDQAAVEESDETDGTAAAGEPAESSGSYDRLGAAAFDEESRRVPAPQRAFNQEYLALDAEAAWGIRESDDAVVVSQLYDAIADREDLRYVGSGQVDHQRMVTIPDAVTDHWDALAEGVAVESGDDVVFATSDDLTADSLLVVVPDRWADDLLGEAE